MNRKIATFLIFLVLVISACKSGNDDSKVLEQDSAAPNQSAIRVSEESQSSAEPAIAADSNGNIFVVYVEHSSKSADVYFQKLNKNAKPSGEKLRVNPEKGNATSWFGDSPTIQIGHDNAIYLGWTAKDANAGKSNATVLYLSVSRDGGKSFEAPVKVNDDNAPSSHGMHSLAIDKNGNVFMAWLDERNVKNENHAQNFAGDHVIEPLLNPLPDDFGYIKASEGEDHNSSNKKVEKPKPESEHSEMENEAVEPNSEIFFAFSKDGGKTFSKNIKISSEVCPCCKTSLTVDTNGRIYASWRQVVGDDFRHIAVASSENGGESFSEYTIVSDDQWQIRACPVSGAPMFLDKNNNLTVFWYTAGKAGKPGLYTADSIDGGKTFLPRKMVYEGAVKGTVSVFSKRGDEFGAFFDGMGEIFQTDQNLNSSQKFEGELPTAVFANGFTYVAFVEKLGEKNGVWIQTF